MADLEQMWRETWMTELGKHLAAELTPLLPADRELVLTGRELAIMIRRDGAPLRAAVTHSLPVPGEHVDLGAAAAEQVLSELQDEVAVHLSRAWPVNDDGVSLHASAADAGDRIALAFVPRAADSTDAVVLAPFVPPQLDRARAAG